MKALILYGAAAVVAAVAAPVERAGGQERSRIDTTIAIGTSGTVDLTIVGGDIVVTGWDRREVRIIAESERGSLRLEQTTNRISLRDDRGRRFHGGDADYRVTVPVGTRVIMAATSGDLSATGTRGDVEASSMSGDIEISDATGEVHVETLSGNIEVQRATGGVRVQAVSGDVTVRRASGPVEVESVSGEIVLREITSKSVRAGTVSGEVEFEGPIAADGRYEMRSHSGDVRVMLPRGVNALVGVSTFSGEIDSDFELTLEPGERRPQHRQFQFRLGSGGARIDLESFSGDIYLDRGTEGRNRQGGAR